MTTPFKAKICAGPRERCSSRRRAQTLVASYRQVVKDALLTLGAHPIEESNFPTDYRELQNLLTRRLAPCHAVIHLVGFHYAGEPNQTPDIPRRS